MELITEKSQHDRNRNVSIHCPVRHGPRSAVSALAVAVALALSACSDGGSESGSPATPSSVDESTTTAPTTTEPREPSETEAPTSTEATTPLRLVVIGDSIPYNSPDDCPGCTGFVERYADELEAATGRAVDVENLSQHNGLTLPMLMDELDQYEATLATADAIIVGAAHNSIVFGGDEVCGTTWDDEINSFVDWTAIDDECSQAGAAEYRPMYDELFATIVEWRAGQPTLLRTLNKYNDWIGWTDGNLTTEMEQQTTMVHDDWNEMICASAEQHGFACADIYHPFNGPDGDQPAGELLASDYTHPSERGNEQIASVLLDQGFAPLT